MTRSKTPTQQLAAFCAGLRWATIPNDARERTKELVLDHVGVAIRGSATESARAARRYVARASPSGRSSLLGVDARSTASWAALANGVAAHSIEMDDVTTESSLHPGVAVIPASLALAEERGVSPTAFLEAVVVGYEVTMRVGNALGGANAYGRGFHPTGVAGAFGAAAAAARVLGLDADGITCAMGIAGTMASGSLEYLADGAWTKRLNPGWAGHAGIVAAELAAEGFTGPASAIEGKHGALHSFTDDPKPERLLADLGSPLQVMRVSIKPYGCCRYNHGLIDAVLQLRREHGLTPDSVASMTLHVLSAGAALVADPIERKRDPRNVVDAQFSAPYAAAVALVRGAAGLREFDAATIADPAVRGLMTRIDCVRDPGLDALYPQIWPAAVTVRLQDGRTLEARITHALGEPENPVPRPALVDRFVELTSHAMDEPAARARATGLLSLDAATDLAWAFGAARSETISARA
ncbi:MAG TPA: MmgE/PrpD family protein [Candidatus Limnocylindria bacterium]|nr:MmgE/PrpD family protein [Candidatus Limnocylindria bacterium]